MYKGPIEAGFDHLVFNRSLDATQGFQASENIHVRTQEGIDGLSEDQSGIDTGMPFPGSKCHELYKGPVYYCRSSTYWLPTGLHGQSALS